MGLDTYVSRSPDEITLTPDDERAFAQAGIDLCGGMCSDGETSFRGKVYDSFILEVTDESLYREWIPPETVAEMAGKLAACDPDSAGDFVDLPQRWAPSPREIRDLQTLFRICAQRGLGLIGSY